MAAVVYFEKTSEDQETVTYRYGPDEADLAGSFTVARRVWMPTADPFGPIRHGRSVG